MKLEQLTTQNTQLHHLLNQSRHWQQLDMDIKKLVPNNLHAYFMVICIQHHDLIIHVDNAMASTRLKMLLPSVIETMRQLDNRIHNIVIKTRPKNPQIKHKKNFYISQNALLCFQNTAKQLTHHKELAQAIQNLLRHNQLPHK